MKRIALLLLALVAATIADDMQLIENTAKGFETDVDTVTGCLKEADTTMVEVNGVMKKIKDSASNEEIDEETKEIVVKHNNFLACMLEKTGMMEGNTLLTDKIIESIKKDKDMITAPDEKELRECLDSLNEDKDKMTNGEMAFGLMLCIYVPSDKK
ncbi:uncharacterized protein LOC109855076 [Pseudomyrmex gracilis]|uniref:uncharacterized protein LOC109855076 n=1 Tax=Pseudomyrmex gracilis TaxID=219809 RepID=UPI000995D41C|nr:uncharacterized protein LOC109855076 [Pseudomyrmex gracilis]